MRLVVIVWRLLPLALAFWRDHRRWLFVGRPAERTALDHERRAERLVATLAALGPTFVKMAQLFAGRTDILATVYARALTTLTDQVPQVPLAEIERVIREEYGAPPAELFERFDEVPIAAASLGQVHRARHAGEEVVVKVLRPGVEALVAQDVRASQRLVALVERWWPNPHVVGTRVVIQEFAARVAEEMDFRQEAAHAVAIRANFAGARTVWIPRVIEPMVRQRALVLEYCAGRRVDRLDEWVTEGRIDPDRIVHDVMELYARMMLVHGLFHADPHPGNVHVAPDGRIILLDFGMVVRVPLELRRQLVAAIFAAIRRDAEALADSFHALGLVVTGADPDVIRRLAGTLLAVAHQRTTTRERVELLADEVVAELYDWPIVLPSHLVYFARTASLIEGLGTHYDPRFNALAFATPIALSLRSRIIASLYPDGGQPRVDPARVIGAALGAVARVVQRAGRDVVSAVRDAVAGATLPELPASVAER
ncbi:MAG TPA: AarF/UbiB family protein [Gemmatimonadaceae bacterium]|jgi:predicted unusual protein kinase regulating ubiquinone biosynthesis (AarF/ABC1/UbiB family)|nr:AarF/UbiB family protein [Gemmatimonadaceae bacterium]